MVKPGVCYGRLDVVLAPNCEDQLAAMRARLLGFAAEVLWSSPAVRCRRTAIALECGLQMIVDDRLLEMDFGEWEGRAWDDVPRDLLDRWAADPAGFAAPGGESGNKLLARVTSFCRDIQASGRDCVIVSHGGPLKLLRAMLAGNTVDFFAAPPAIGSVTMFN